MASKHYEATTTMAAAPERISAILVDASTCPTFEPYWERIEGSVELGGKLKAFTELTPGRAFPVKVTELAAGLKARAEA